jgi:hypothetical protein
VRTLADELVQPQLGPYPTSSRHRGGARPSRFPRDVCAHPYGTGLDPTTTKAVIDTAFAVIYNRVLRLPRVKAEPPVRRYARIRR